MTAAVVDDRAPLPARWRSPRPLFEFKLLRKTDIKYSRSFVHRYAASRPSYHSRLLERTVKKSNLTFPLAVIFFVAVTIAGGGWLTLHLLAKQKYDEVRDQLAQQLPTYAVVRLNAETMALIEDIRVTWVERDSEVGGLHSDALQTVGLQPTVKNLVDLFTRPMPEYSFLSLERNQKSLAVGVVQGALLPKTVDRSIHLADDGRLAFVRVGKNLVYIFADEPTGLHEAMYYQKQEQKPENNESEAAGDADNRRP